MDDHFHQRRWKSGFMSQIQLSQITFVLLEQLEFLWKNAHLLTSKNTTWSKICLNLENFQRGGKWRATSACKKGPQYLFQHFPNSNCNLDAPLALDASKIQSCAQIWSHITCKLQLLGWRLLLPRAAWGLRNGGSSCPACSTGSTSAQCAAPQVTHSLQPSLFGHLPHSASLR